MARTPRKPKRAQPVWKGVSKRERERMIQELRSELRKIGTHDYLNRLEAVRWIAEGRSYEQVATLVRLLTDRAVSKRTIARWIRIFDQKGADGLHDRTSRAATAAYEAGPKIERLHARGISTAQIARCLHLGHIWVRRSLALRTGQRLP